MTIKIAKQYIKELSIKVPNSPGVFMQEQTKPDIQISIDIDAKKISDTAYEVVLKIKADGGKDKLFEVTIDYAGLFVLENAKAQESIEETLLVECPTMLFPYTRHVVSNLTADAGFSPLMLDPIDFSALYNKRKESVTIN